MYVYGLEVKLDIYLTSLKLTLINILNDVPTASSTMTALTWRLPLPKEAGMGHEQLVIGLVAMFGVYTNYTIPYYTILYYTILYYAMPYYTIIYYTIIYYTSLYTTILYYTIYCTRHTIYYMLYTVYYILYTIYYTTLCYAMLRYAMPYYTILYCTILYYNVT